MPTEKPQSRNEIVLPFEDAQRLVLEHAAGLHATNAKSAADATDAKIERVSLLQSRNRTLAEEVRADRDFPPFRRAARDGYAVRAGDLKTFPELKVVGEIRAGGEPPPGFKAVQAGQAISIMTGAPVPAGADSVVMVEYTEREGDRVRVLRVVAAGENVVPQASEAAAGSVLLVRGTILSPSHIALAAAAGRPELTVYRRPRVAILPTGDEVVPIADTPKANQIRNSNSFSLAAQVMDAGGDPVQLAIARDEAAHLRRLIEEGLESDLLLLSGGVSAGEYDLVEGILQDFSAEFLFTGVEIQPGKPLVFGRALAPKAKRWTYFFGLPGNPISTMVTFELFARSMIRALTGAPPEPLRTTKASLAGAVKVKPGLTRFLPGRLVGEWNNVQVQAVKWQGSGDVAAFAQANCLLVVPPDRERFDAGELISVLPITH